MTVTDYNIPEIGGDGGALVLTFFQNKLVQTAVMRAATSEDLR